MRARAFNNGNWMRASGVSSNLQIFVFRSALGARGIGLNVHVSIICSLNGANTNFNLPQVMYTL